MFVSAYIDVDARMVMYICVCMTLLSGVMVYKSFWNLPAQTDPVWKKSTYSTFF